MLESLVARVQGLDLTLRGFPSRFGVQSFGSDQHVGPLEFEAYLQRPERAHRQRDPNLWL